MSTSAKAVRFDDDSLWVELDDGRRIAVPLAWFPRLLAASPTIVQIDPQAVVIEAHRFS